MEHHPMTTPPSTVRIARLLVLLNALIWLLFGVITAAGAHPSFREAGLLRWAMAASAFIAAIILVALAGLLKRRSRFGYILTVVMLAVMILASLFDDFGLADLLFVLVTLLPLASLLKDRAWYLRPTSGGEQEQPAA
jgi:lysylphosphatidylglycerol synthetase-like protein (DUF2156 family)